RAADPECSIDTRKGRCGRVLINDSQCLGILRGAGAGMAYQPLAAIATFENAGTPGVLSQHCRYFSVFKGLSDRHVIALRPAVEYDAVAIQDRDDRTVEELVVLLRANHR